MGSSKLLGVEGIKSQAEKRGPGPGRPWCCVREFKLDPVAGGAL